MKRSLWLVVPVVLAAVVLARPLWSEEGSDGGGGGGMPEALKPGPEHKEMAKWAGKYNVATKYWMDPTGAPMESKGTAEFTSLFEGRYLRQDYKGEMMGMPFTGIGFDGFDRVTNKYCSVWIDSMGTQVTYLEGTSKDGGKTIEYKGKMSDPMANKQVDSRWVHTTKSDDSFVFELYMTQEGKEVKGMELTYTRAK
jgi:hypothetical protein